jgi:hypothetical protein
MGNIVRGNIIRGNIVRGNVVRGNVVRGNVVRGNVVRGTSTVPWSLCNNPYIMSCGNYITLDIADHSEIM